MFCDKIFYSSIFFWKQITNCSYHFTIVIQSDRNDTNIVPNDPFSTSTSLYLCLCLCICLCLSLSHTHKWSSSNYCFLLFSHELNISEFMCTCLSGPDLFHEWTVTLHIWYMFFIPSYTAGHWLEHIYIYCIEQHYTEHGSTGISSTPTVMLSHGMLLLLAHKGNTTLLNKV